MVKTFAIVLAFWNTIEETQETYILEYGLTGQECIQQIPLWVSLADQANASLACEVEFYE